MKPGGDFSDGGRCPEHGRLDERHATMAWIHEQWTRRGKPESFNLYLSPIQ